MNLGEFGVELWKHVLLEGTARERCKVEVCLVAEQLLCFRLEVREFLLKNVLLSSEVVIEDDLILQVAHHLIPNLICLVDPARDRPVPRRELVQCLSLRVQILRLKDESILL